MAVKFTNNAKTTLASGINSSVTTATVTDGSVFPTLAAGEHFYCTFDDGTNNEIVKVTARSGNTLTIIRGVDNTTARSFASGDAAELRATSALLTDIQENIAAKSANQTVYNTTTASSATDYDIGIDPSVEANAMVFLNGVMQHHDTFSFSGSTLTFDTAPPNGMALEVIVDNLINLQSSNLTVDTFTAADVGGNPQTDFTLSDAPAAEDNLLVFIDGVFQDQDAYTISNQTLTITDGVTADFGVTVYVINPVNIGTPSDGTVTSSKLSGNITMPADLTVTGDVAFDSPTFVVDNANSRVGIGTASPSTLLDIVGDVKMSANLTVDTSTLHVDATNNRVGIGTTSPNGKLTISNSGAGGFEFTPDTTNFGVANTNYIASYDRSASTYRDISFDMGGAESSSIRFKGGSGNVGIGTSSPTVELDVRDDGANGICNIGVRGGTNGAGAVQISGHGTTYGSTSFDIIQNSAGGYVYNRANLPVIFGTNNTERMRIDSSGNVVVGHTAALGSATNRGNITINGSSDSVLSLGNGGSLKGYILQDSSGMTIYSDGATYQRFYTNGSERMRIASNGRTSIGTTTTNAGLTVANADIRCTGAAIANDANSISMSQESPGAYITARGPSTSTRGTLHLSVNQSNGGGGRVGFKIDNLGLIYAEYMGSGGATTDVNYNTSTGEIYQVTSSQRYKENISEYTDSILEKINNLTVKNFDYKEGGYTNQVGLIAEEVEEQIPYLVNKKEIEGYDEPQPDSVKYSQLSVFLLKAIQEQQAQIETLKQEIREIREGG